MKIRKNEITFLISIFLLGFLFESIPGYIKGNNNIQIISRKKMIKTIQTYRIPSIDELEALPGVGTYTAELVIEYLKDCKIKGKEPDLQCIRGIGKKRAEVICGLIYGK